MVAVENIVPRLLSRLGNPSPVRRLLGSAIAWKLSGLTYGTAVIATTGSYLDIDTYVAEMETRMKRLEEYLPPNSVSLDFGTGLGGNLFGARKFIRKGVGVDVNPFFVRRAGLIARRRNYSNLSFLPYDGRRLPVLEPFDCFISIGTFERLSPQIVSNYLSQAVVQCNAHARFILYFLTERSRDSTFGQLLGQERYVYWTEEKLHALFDTNGLVEFARLHGFPNVGDCIILDTK